MRRNDGDYRGFRTMDTRGYFDSREAESFNRAKSKRKNKISENKKRKHDKWDNFC